MALFLKRENNLNDIENIVEARRNLGFGTLATYNSDNISITGGSVAVDSLVLKFDEEPPENSFLQFDRETTEIKYVQLDLNDWVKSNAEDINLSQFQNDKYFFDSSQIHTVGLTGDYNDLENKPTNLTDLTNDLEFLNIYSNLSDIRNIEAAKKNLGLGSIADLNTDYVSFENLTVTNLLIFDNTDISIDDNPKYLYINEEGNTYWSNMSKATATSFGVVKLNDDYLSDANDTVPSSVAIRNLFANLTNRIDNINDVDKLDEDPIINEFKTNSKIMYGINSLREIENVQHARSNLGFTESFESLLSEINGNGNYTFNTMIVQSNLYFSTDSFPYINGYNTYLSVDKNGRVIPKNIRMATSNNPGLVFVSEDIRYGTDDILKTTIPSMFALSNFIENEIRVRIRELEESLPSDMNDIVGNDRYMRINQNLSVDNPSIARDHLQLHNVSYSGNYHHLINTPTNLSDFSNTDTKFLKADCNLSDIGDIVTARLNLGLGNICTLNADEIDILNGNATFSNLIVSENFQYNYDESADFTNMVLMSEAHNGLAKWKPIPIANSSTYGMVKVGNNHQLNDDNIASSTSALYKMYYELKGRIDALE